MTGPHQRVVVTGLGATTPLAGDAPGTWEAMLDGRSGVRVLEQEWASQIPVQIAAPLAVEPPLERIEARTLDRSERMALVAAREAWADAGSPEADPLRLMSIVGSGIGGVITLLDQYDVLKERGARRVSPHTVPMLMPNGSAATIGIAIGARAGVHTPVSACASGAEAIGLALDLIRAGRADIAIAGGTEAAIHPLPMAGFAAMRALSTWNDRPDTASRPFDVDRNGFVLGEGAGMLVLETEEHALARGARIYGAVAGYGASADAHHIAQPEPTGAGAARAVKQALATGDLSPADVRHINAHATSTPVGDVAETKALRSALGPALDDVVVTATKSMTGHSLGAAGAIEAVISVLTLQAGLVPPTRNLDTLDAEIDLDVVTVDPRKIPAGAVLSNSFGFGGHNVCLAFTA